MRSIKYKTDELCPAFSEPVQLAVPTELRRAVEANTYFTVVTRSHSASVPLFSTTYELMRKWGKADAINKV